MNKVRTNRPDDRWLFRGYTAESLGALRIALALGYLLYQITQFYPLVGLRSQPAWVLLEPMWYVQALGIERVDALHVHLALALSLLATLGVLVGRFTRASIVTIMLSMMYLKGIRDSIVGDTHHRLLIWWMLFLFLLLSESHRVYALDAKRTQRVNAPAMPTWQSSWPIRAMQLYLVSFYLWSGIAKLRVSGWAWLDGGGKLREVLLRRSAIWGLDAAGEPLGNPLAYELAQHPDWLEVLGAGVLGMELAFPALLLLRSNRTRLIALGVVSVFHVTNFVLLYVGFVLMPLAFVVFFDLAPVAQRVRERSRRPREDAQNTFERKGAPLVSSSP